MSEKDYEDADFMAWFIEQSNSSGEDFNDGDEHPGWLTGTWLDDELFEITYENPDNEKYTQRYKIYEVE